MTELHESHEKTEQIIARIPIDEENGIYIDLYERQVETAAIRLSPILSRLREAEQCRQLMNESLLALELSSNLNLFEKKIEIPEMAFVIFDRAVPFRKYLRDLGGNSENAGAGIKQPGEIVLFDSLILRSKGADTDPEIEAEICEDTSSTLPLGLDSKTEKTFTEVNIIRFDPNYNRIGFLVHDAGNLHPDIELS